ncbi:MAG: DUF1801 domain-containing protein [Rhodobacteraceae bacterium]|nr:DUF1801 domain-containing protein [Paracoccaceae bacterium]
MEAILKFYGKDIEATEFDSWLEQKAEVLRPIASKWFEVIKDVGPEVEAIFRDNYPIGCIEDAPFAYVNVYTAHVNVGFFYGSYLSDPSGILEGTGKHMRHVKLRPGADHNDQAIATLIVAAYKDIKNRLNRIG